MGFLRKRGPKPAEITQYSGLQIQSSSNAVPITICYGVNKVAGNLIWYGHFQALPQYSKNGGKGGSRQTLTGYNYTTAFVLGLCEGPIVSVGRVWKDDGAYTPAYLAIGIAHGTSTQNLSGVTNAYSPSQALSYRGLAYAESYIYFLGSTATIGNLQFEISGRKQETAFVNAYDADPAEIIFDFLINVQYGVGFPPGLVDVSSLFGESGGSSYQSYCRAMGIGLSPVLANRESANSILKRWLQLTNSDAVWSGGTLKIIPYGDVPIAGRSFNGTPTYFNPNLTAIYALTDDDFVGDADSDPVVVERRDEAGVFNVQQLEFSDRSTGYNSSSITVWDQNSIEKFRRRDGSTITAHEICDRNIAQIVAQLILQREVYIRNVYSFKLSFEYCLLDPMDIVTLTDAALGLKELPVRIISIEEDDDGLLIVTAEEFPGSVGSAASYIVQGNEAVALDRNVIPFSVNSPIIFEPPSALTGGELQVWLAVSAGRAIVRRLEADSTAREHLVAAFLGSRRPGTSISFSVYIRADQINACRLRIYDGDRVQSTSFDLSNETSFGSTPGITSAAITGISEGSWFLVQVRCVAAGSGGLVASIALENSNGTTAFGGIAGEGLFVWNPQIQFDDRESLPLSSSLMPIGSTFEPDPEPCPSGITGVADPYWGGCIIHLSTDNASYAPVGEINGAARVGVITELLDGSDTAVSVNLGESGGLLEGSPALGDVGTANLSLIGDELVGYGFATMIGSNSYRLEGLFRGLYGTSVPVMHPVGSRFARLDGAIFKYTVPKKYIGMLIYLKFQSFNIFGQSLQDLSTCATYTFLPKGVGTGVGLILEQLALGREVDLGTVAETAAVEEDIGVIASGITATVDLGELL